MSYVPIREHPASVYAGSSDRLTTQETRVNQRRSRASLLMYALSTGLVIVMILAISGNSQETAESIAAFAQKSIGTLMAHRLPNGVESLIPSDEGKGGHVIGVAAVSNAPDPDESDRRWLAQSSSPQERRNDYVVYALSSINSSGNEYSPIFASQEGVLYFSSDRNGGTGNHDMWRASYRGDGPTMFGPPEDLSSTINTELSDGAGTISPDGRFMYYVGCNRDDGKGDCDIYLARFVKGKWVDQGPVAVLNSEGWDSQPSLSANGDTLYFVSNRLGGMGGSDIYRSIRVDGPQWSPPVNLGGRINSYGNESSVKISAGGDKLYVSSDRPGGMGEYDLYVSRRLQDHSWDILRNMGAPFNTEAAERMIIPINGEEEFIISSSRTIPENLGGLDLYLVSSGSSRVQNIHARTEEVALRVSPSPARSSIRISATSGNTIDSERPAFLFDNEGRQIRELASDEINDAIDISGLPSGSYMLVVGNLSTRFLVQH